MVLYGVRTGDVKKLDSDTWVSFFDFYLDICKTMVDENMDVATKAYKKWCIQESNSTMTDCAYCIGNLFGNSTLDIKLADDHLFNLAKNDYELLTKDSENQGVVNALNYIRKI